MTSQITVVRSNHGSTEISKANYQGLTVQVILQMEQCSLVRYQNRDFVVDTQDLHFARRHQSAG